jgi:hypothetical protein
MFVVVVSLSQIRNGEEGTVAGILKGSGAVEIRDYDETAENNEA